MDDRAERDACIRHVNSREQHEQTGVAEHGQNEQARECPHGDKTAPHHPLAPSATDISTGTKTEWDDESRGHKQERAGDNAAQAEAEVRQQACADVAVEHDKERKHARLGGGEPLQRADARGMRLPNMGPFDAEDNRGGDVGIGGRSNRQLNRALRR